MDTNKEDSVFEEPIIKETRMCKSCGRTLPLNMFKAYKGGKHSTICNSCANASKGISDKFKDITSRELIIELRNRGYVGELHYTVSKTVKI